MLFVSADAIGTGIWSTSGFGTGVRGDTSFGYGVHGHATSEGAGVYGESVDGKGVVGHSISTIGVLGTSITGVGLSGSGATGGVEGYSNSGTGVRAQSDAGKALDVVGKAHFSRSGKATITAGHASVTVTVPGGLSGSPLCFANLRRYRSGVAVAAVRPNYPTAGKMRIYLTKSVSGSTSVAWIVMD